MTFRENANSPDTLATRLKSYTTEDSLLAVDLHSTSFKIKIKKYLANPNPLRA